jgi:hypothetical protein
MHSVEGPDGTWQEGPNDRAKQRRIMRRLLAAGADPAYAVPDHTGPQTGQTALFRAELEITNDTVDPVALHHKIAAQ